MIKTFTIFSGETFADCLDCIHGLFDRRERISVTVSTEKSRSDDQNRISHAWYAKVSHETGEDTPEGIKRFCKAYFGVPILRADSEKFRDVYDRVIKPLPYDQKLAAMDLISVTSIMTTKQLTQYLETMQKHYANRDTDPVLLDFPGDVV